jgi:hypothetical protein
MRRLSVPAAIAMFLALSFSASSMEWLEGMNPANLRGSFYPTCAECRVDQNGYLICRCAQYDGQIGPVTALRLTYCDRDTGPENHNGILICKPILNGSWHRSCREPTYVQGNSLASHCGPNYSESTSINLDSCPSMDIENINGQLRCRQ